MRQFCVLSALLSALATQPAPTPTVFRIGVGVKMQTTTRQVAVGGSFGYVAEEDSSFDLTPFDPKKFQVQTRDSANGQFITLPAEAEVEGQPGRWRFEAIRGRFEVKVTKLVIRGKD